MNTITLTVQAITRNESLVLKKFGLRTFAELDRTGKPCAFFGEVHASSLNDVPRKPLITRKRTRASISGNRLLRSVQKSKRIEIQRKGCQLDRVAAYCHTRLKGEPIARDVLEAGIMKDLGLKSNQARPAVSDLLDSNRYNQLQAAD